MLIDQTLSGKSLLLVVTGGIAAYKTPDLVRRLQERGAKVRVVMTKGAQHFISAMTLGAVSGQPVFTELWDRDAEQDIGHIRLAREAELIIIAPATADFIAKLAHGLADDLASTICLASDGDKLVVPAMNPKMWEHPATKRNVTQLREDGLHILGPEAGEMAESGEAGVGRMTEPMDIAIWVERHFAPDRAEGPLAGKHVVVTAGPTHEAIDPVRYIANRSSGKQGYALAAAAYAAGAEVTLVSGPTNLHAPEGVDRIQVETAEHMLQAVQAALPADIGIFAAAVADWRVASAADQKLKKKTGEGPPALQLVQNPDILATIASSDDRPKIVIGFAAETDDVEANAKGKLVRKGADFIVANDVSPHTGIMGGDANTVSVAGHSGVEQWPTMGKADVARKLIDRFAEALASLG
ncbi:MAG: bifunctional phosphopantothenoylcysteine decarboxylase/phosphopantothenate--cysteine ligase CoaBC [Pseudomonadota bacterium]